MKIQLLISTMNQVQPNSLIEAIRVKGPYVIINQITKIETIPPALIDGISKFLSYKETGLSRSRNRAVGNAGADICVLADDDMYYEDDYEKTIASAYEEFPDADIIIFRVDNENGKPAKKTFKKGRLRIWQTMRVASWQISFKRKSITEAGIVFDNQFGTGADISMGEENIFLFDCAKKGMKVYSYPIKIATLRADSESTWFNGYNEKYFFDFGKIFYRMSPLLYPVLIGQFVIRKRQLYREKFNLLHIAKVMFSGAKTRKNLRNIYYAGDFVNDTGPAIVNKSYEPFMAPYVFVCKTNNKIIRIMHFLLSLPKMDTVILSGNSNFHVQIIKIANILNIKTSYLMHGYAAVEYKDDLKKINDEMYILSNCSTVVCVSKSFAEYLTAVQPEISSKIRFVNNGAGGIYDSVEKTMLKSAVGGIFKIVSVGGGMLRKNNLAVCEAIESINDDSIEFSVIGPKYENGDLICKYKFVKYYETLPHDRVLEVMKNSDLYIQNSSFETFGLAVCEAVEAGCSVILSKHVGATEVIDGMDDENTVDNYNDILEIASKIRSARLSPSMVRFKNNSSWRDASERLLEIVREGSK